MRTRKKKKIVQGQHLMAKRCVALAQSSAPNSTMRSPAPITRRGLFEWLAGYARSTLQLSARDSDLWAWKHMKKAKLAVPRGLMRFTPKKAKPRKGRKAVGRRKEGGAALKTVTCSESHG